MSAGESKQHWWTDFFDDTYADIGLTGATEKEKQAADKAAEWICSVLQIESGNTLFDQCCGIGRLSLPLARRGIHVVGADLTDQYVERAREAAQREQLPCTFYQGDCFDFVAPDQCDAGINWFTSFGYHDDDRENQKMLQCAFDSLRPGARFALDYISLTKVLRGFQSCNVTRRSLDDGSELLWLDEPSIDFAAGTISSTWTWIPPAGERTVRRTRVRMYLPHDLIRLFKNVGFDQIELHGSRCGEPFDLDSKRCVVVGVRP
jgi:SAM-dependent methyltransferase